MTMYVILETVYFTTEDGCEYTSSKPLEIYHTENAAYNAAKQYNELWADMMPIEEDGYIITGKEFIVYPTKRVLR